MKSDWKMVLVVLLLGAALSGLILLHCELDNVCGDVVTHQDGVSSIDIRPGGFEADTDSMFTDVSPSCLASLPT